MMVKNRLYFLLDTFLLLLIDSFSLLQIVIIGIEGKRKFFKQSVYSKNFFVLVKETIVRPLGCTP